MHSLLARPQLTVLQPKGHINASNAQQLLSPAAARCGFRGQCGVAGGYAASGVPRAVRG
jgi:hypothetical protein